MRKSVSWGRGGEIHRWRGRCREGRLLLHRSVGVGEGRGRLLKVDWRRGVLSVRHVEVRQHSRYSGWAETRHQNIIIIVTLSFLVI